MDAVEKVARALYALDTGDGENYEWFADQYARIAEGLISVFPQLALEGREEWGVRHSQGTVACRSEADARDRYSADVAYDARRQLASRGKTRLVKRAAAGQWVEVKS